MGAACAAGRLGLAAVLLLAMVPVATADHVPACSDATVIPQPSPVYLYTSEERSRAEAWEEANELPGLQRVACEAESGEVVDPDSLVVAVPPEVPETPSVSDVIAQATQFCEDITPPRTHCTLA